MSWNISVRTQYSRVREELKNKFWETYPNPEAETLDQFVTAAAIVAELLVSVVPRETEDERNKRLVAVSMTGHSNPEHRPKDGYSNDFVTISVYQV
jgi:hypothetical protein